MKEHQSDSPMGAVKVVRSTAGSVRSENHATPPFSNPCHFCRDMVRTDAIAVTNTGNCKRGPPTIQKGCGALICFRNDWNLVAIPKKSAADAFDCWISVPAHGINSLNHPFMKQCSCTNEWFTKSMFSPMFLRMEAYVQQKIFLEKCHLLSLSEIIPRWPIIDSWRARRHSGRSAALAFMLFRATGNMAVRTPNPTRPIVAHHGSPTNP